MLSYMTGNWLHLSIQPVLFRPRTPSFLMCTCCSLEELECKFNPPCAHITVPANFFACPSRSHWLDICPMLDSIWLSQLACRRKMWEESLAVEVFIPGDLLTQSSCHHLGNSQTAEQKLICDIYVFKSQGHVLQKRYFPDVFYQHVCSLSMNPFGVKNVLLFAPIFGKCAHAVQEIRTLWCHKGQPLPS